jgi:hypothetical protein
MRTALQAPRTMNAPHLLHAQQLLLCRKWESALPAVCGLLAGMLWRAEALPLHRFRIPQVICKCFAVSAARVALSTSVHLRCMNSVVPEGYHPLAASVFTRDAV